MGLMQSLTINKFSNENSPCLFSPNWLQCSLSLQSLQIEPEIKVIKVLKKLGIGTSVIVGISSAVAAWCGVFLTYTE